MRISALAAAALITAGLSACSQGPAPGVFPATDIAPPPSLSGTVRAPSAPAVAARPARTGTAPQPRRPLEVPRR
ncbi:hypothetical protein [Microvirga pudoricolor]|uniref:hypothetical protein n=1 Tax=Microvirga pudoricolor TaxID=2778729 RepID=UPI00195177B2|nr:hypothetical protein [Microvirga pudoricolor]